jgi:hypothetical protein
VEGDDLDGDYIAETFAHDSEFRQSTAGSARVIPACLAGAPHLADQRASQSGDGPGNLLTDDER